jgi:uncharacterized membrane protein YhiD involved in acid resistance
MRVGVTSAAGLLVVAGIGSAVGLGMYGIAVAATGFALFAFMAVLILEKKIESKLRPQYDK